MVTPSRTHAIDATGNEVRVVLASASPRRRDLLRRLGIDPEVRVPDVDESAQVGEDPADMAERLAVAKAAAVPVADGEVVIAADTVVCVDGAGWGKPANAADATRMLASLSGRAHDVVTGVAVRTPTASASTVELTRVEFRTLTVDEIDDYVSTGEPMGKAGAYAIQGRAGMFVTTVDGSDTNVIGLPLATTVALLGGCGISVRLGG